MFNPNKYRSSNFIAIYTVAEECFYRYRSQLNITLQCPL